MPDAVAYDEHLVEVVTEKLDGYAGLGTAEHGVDTVADGLAYLDVGSAYGRELLTHLVQQFRVGAVFQYEGSLYLGYIDTQGVLVQFGASGLAGHGLDLGNGQQQFLGPASDAVGFLQGDAGQGADVNRERAFVERRQEAVSESEEQAEGRCEQGQGRASDYGLVVQCPVQAVAVVLLEPYGHECLLGHLGAVLLAA